MPDKRLFEPIIQNINKCEVRLEKYNLPVLRLHHEREQQKSIGETQEDVAEPKRDSKELSNDNKVPRVSSAKGALFNNQEESREIDENAILEAEKTAEELERERIVNKYVPFTKDQEMQQPKLCMWLLMSDLEADELLQLSQKGEIIKYIDYKLNSEYPKGTGRLLIIELLYSVVRFCKKSKFTIMQSATLLSIFYLTHQFLLGSLYRNVQKVYCFFKEFMLLHCFECPPDCMKIFNYKEATSVALYFCTVYLANIPLIRMLTLPNFGLHLNYEKLPDPFEDKKGKKGKDKKGKGKKGKKKK